MRPLGLQHARLPCPSPTPRARSNSSIDSVMPSNHLILCRPLLLLPSILPSIRVFSNESALRIRWPKYWNFSFTISLSNEYSGLISFRIDWLDLLAVQGTLKSLLQHHSSKASILQHSAIFTVLYFLIFALIFVLSSTQFTLNLFFLGGLVYSKALFLGTPKSLQMMIAAMKLKDTPWKDSYDQPR